MIYLAFFTSISLINLDNKTLQKSLFVATLSVSLISISLHGTNSYNNFKLLDIGDFVGVEGNIFKTKTKEISIRTDKLTVLAKSIRPLPIVKEKDGKQFDAFLDKGQRYRKRHLDLILNPDVKKTFIDRSIIIKIFL